MKSVKKLKAVKLFLLTLLKKFFDDEMTIFSGELTYKLILSIFPFLIFAMSLVGFFNLDGNLILSGLDDILPYQIYNLLNVFVREVINQKQPGVLSVSLIVSIFSSSSGFDSIIRGINKTYGITDNRNFLLKRAVSIGLTLLFAAVLISSAALLVFRDKLISLLSSHIPDKPFISVIFSYAGYAVSIFLVFYAIIIIYKFSCKKKIKLTDFTPGALLTVIIWTLAGKAFNIYVNNFSNYSRIYGSIAGVFILMFWLNLISTTLLLGSELNAMLTFED
ncbi:MAG: YihY/virulence factor BrkB family protein [Clostridiales bacterium]|jgi:membrane protein|nr:YihY/virulence factor BrkB family protein [Clostridiales bacterium]